MKRFEAIAGAIAIVLAAAAATPAGAENVLRWASATEALTFDPHAANYIPTMRRTSQVYEPLVGFNSTLRDRACARRRVEADRRDDVAVRPAPGRTVP